MTVSNTQKTTPRTYLRSVPGIDLSNRSLALDLVADHVVDHAARPNREPPIPSFTAMLSLLKIQILKHKNTILRSPFDKLLRSAITEILSYERSPDFQPFEGSDNAPSILPLCLSLSQLSLKAFDRLRCALVLDSSIQAAYKKLVTICINRHDSICLVQIDANRMNSFYIRKFNRVGHIADKLISQVFDYNAINFSGVVEVFFERIGDSVTKMFPTIDCRNTQKPALRETGVSAPLSNKEKSERPIPIERVLKVMMIPFGSCISTSSQPDACASELAGNRSFDIIVDSAMQIKSFQRFALVPSSLRYAVAYLSKAIESLDERFVILDNYLQGSLGKHNGDITTMRINALRVSGGENGSIPPLP